MGFAAQRSGAVDGQGGWRQRARGGAAAAVHAAGMPPPPPGPPLPGALPSGPPAAHLPGVHSVGQQAQREERAGGRHRFEYSIHPLHHFGVQPGRRAQRAQQARQREHRVPAVGCASFGVNRRGPSVRAAPHAVHQGRPCRPQPTDQPTQPHLLRAAAAVDRRSASSSRFARSALLPSAPGGGALGGWLAMGGGARRRRAGASGGRSCCCEGAVRRPAMEG